MAQFNHSLFVSNVGAFIANGNPAGGDSIPQWTASLDYFHNLATASTDPDSDTTAPVISNVDVTPGTASATVSWETNELASCALVELEGALTDVPVVGSRAFTFTALGETYVELRCTDADGAQYLGYGGVRVF